MIVAGALVVALLGAAWWAIATAPTCYCPPEDDCGGGCNGKRRG